jgi:hypothetical protein
MDGQRARRTGAWIAAAVALAACTSGGLPLPGGSIAPVSAQSNTPASVAASAPSSTEVSSTGPFDSSVFAVPISLSPVGDWVVQGDNQSDIDLQRGDQDAGILSISSTTIAPAMSGDPALPWPEDLHAWLEARPEFTPTVPRQVALGGRPATLVDADARVPSGTRVEMVCSEPRHSCWLVDHADRWRFIEVKSGDGPGIVVITNGTPDAFDSYARALDQLLATLKFR